jgi:MFS family permease
MGFGAGSLVGMALIAGVTNDKYKGNILMLTGIASGVTPILLILSGNILVVIIMASAMGASQATFMAITNTYVQSIAPDRLRGRISSLYVMHAGGIMAFSNLGYGFIADRLTVPPIFVATGLMFIIIMLVSYAVEPILRRVYTTGSITRA